MKRRDPKQLVFNIIDELEQVLDRSGLSLEGKRRAVGVLWFGYERQLERRAPARAVAPAPAPARRAAR